MDARSVKSWWRQLPAQCAIAIVICAATTFWSGQRAQAQNCDPSCPTVTITATPEDGGALLIIPILQLEMPIIKYPFHTAGTPSASANGYDSAKNANCPHPSLSPSARHLIDAEEGKGPNGLDQGYVPDHGTGAGSASGATLNYGVDLARQTASAFSQAGVSSTGLQSMASFLETKSPPVTVCYLHHCFTTWHWVLGPTGTQAQELLNVYGLSVSSTDSADAGNAAFSEATSMLNTQIGITAYEQMPETLQDALADVVYAGGSLTTAMVEDIQAKDWSNLAVDTAYALPNDPARASRIATMIAAAQKSGDVPVNGSSICP